MPEYDGYAVYLENDLELSIMERNTLSLIDSINLLPWYEDKEEENSAANSILDKIIEGIQNVCEKIRSILRGAARAITNMGKDRLSYDDYRKSDTGDAKVKARIAELEKEIDDAFLAARPVISMISKITHIDPKKVESVCDKVNEKIAKVDWLDVASKAIPMALQYKGQMNKHKEEIDKATNACESATAQIKTSKFSIREKTALGRAVNNVSMMYAKLSNKVFGALSEGKKTPQKS